MEKIQDFIVNIPQRTTDGCVLLCTIYLWWYKKRTKVIEKESKAICKSTMKIIWINNFLVINIKTIDRFTRTFLFMHIRWESSIVMSCSWCWTFWCCYFFKETIDFSLIFIFIIIFCWSIITRMPVSFRRFPVLTVNTLYHLIHFVQSTYFANVVLMMDAIHETEEADFSGGTANLS